MPTTEALVAEELVGQPGAIIAPGYGDLAGDDAPVIAGVSLAAARAS